MVTARVDLHCHSAASYDGAVDPVRLVELARERGLTHLAITDHETLDGARAARVAGITLIVGQEVRTAEGDLIVSTAVELRAALRRGTAMNVRSAEEVAGKDVGGGLRALFSRLRGPH